MRTISHGCTALPFLPDRSGGALPGSLTRLLNQISPQPTSSGRALTNLLAPILDDTAELWEATKAPTDCFLHGDCHTDNILIDDDELVWTDWQGAGGGNPSVELAFPSIRAAPSGAVLPQAEMIRRYAMTRGLDETELSRAVLAAELSIFLFVWPEYACYNTAFGINRVHERVQHLARRWLRSQ